MVSRLQENGLGRYDDRTIQDYPVIKQKNFIYNNSLNSSPSLFVQEHEGNEQKLYTKLEKLNLENVTQNAISKTPDWFQKKYEILAALGRLQEQGSYYPDTYEVPNSVLRAEQMLLNHQGDVNISAAERQDLYNLIRRLAPPPRSVTE